MYVPRWLLALRSLRRYVSTAKSLTAKCPYGEVPVRRSARTPKCPAAQCPAAKSLTGKFREPRQIKVTHGHYVSMEQLPTYKDWRRHSSNNRAHPKERHSLTIRRLQFFGFTDKTMKQLLNDGYTTYGDTLCKLVTSIDLLTKL